MSAVTITTDQADASRHRLDSSIKATPAIMRKALTRMIIEVEREVKRFARSGGAFSRRSTGRLARTTGHQVSGSDIAVITTGVKYGAIQEFGGTTSPHIIRPRFAKALAFVGRGGGMIFRKEVHHPGSRIPGTHYAAKSLDKQRDTIQRLGAQIMHDASGGK